MPNQDDQKKKPSGPPHVSDLILGSLKPRTGRETSRWIAGLADNAVREAAEAAAKDIESGSVTPSGNQPTLKGGAQQAVISFTDSIFDHFQQYEYDFNRSVAGTDYVITIERPIYNTEHVRSRFRGPETVKAFRGRVSTRYWTLILRACNDMIEGWIVPIEQIFSFRADDEMYPPIVSVEPVATRNGELAWRVNNTELTAEQARAVAKQLFSALILVAKGEAQPAEAFTILEKPDMRKTGEYGPADPSLSSRSSGSSIPQMQPPASMASSHPSLQKLEPAAPPRQAMQPEAPALQTPAKTPKQTLRNNTLRNTQTKANKVSAANAAAPTDANMDTVITMFNQVVNKALEQLSAEGAAAFSKQDLVTVEAVCRRTKAVKDLQNQLNHVMLQWKKAYEDALKS